MPIAITREVSPAIASCELTHLQRVPIDYERAVSQHRSYCELLASLGAEVRTLPADPAHPDSVFVEDTAIVFNELAVVTRPGAPSRRGETADVARELALYRPLARIEAPATVDGGDVLLAGRTLFVGLSSRTETAAVEQLRVFLAPHGYRVVPVDVTGCLHLKSAVTAIADGLLLANRDWFDPAPFAGYEFLDVAPGEEYGANALRLGEAIVYGAGYPRTAEAMRARGLDVHVTDQSELAKAEGAVTCCSVIVP